MTRWVYTISFVYFLQIISFGQCFSVNITSEPILFFGRQFREDEWRTIQETIDCWSKNGSWIFSNKTIVDEISLYRACWRFLSYGHQNPCHMILDFDSLKYDWISNCSQPLQTFSATRFCHFMKNRRDVIIVVIPLTSNSTLLLKKHFY